MKERLLQLLDLEQISPSKFADIIGVQRSSVSHVISGRNKPSFDFLQKTLGAFPGLNASWLMMGEGTMYEQMGRNLSGNLFDPAPESAEETSEDLIHAQEAEIGPKPPSEELKADREIVANADSHKDKEENTAPESVQTAIPKGNKKIVQVMVIYEDDTFRTYMPAH